MHVSLLKMRSVNAVLTALVLQEIIRSAVAIIVLVKVMMNMQQTITFARGDAAGLPVEVVANEPEVSAHMGVLQVDAIDRAHPTIEHVPIRLAVVVLMKEIPLIRYARVQL